MPPKSRAKHPKRRITLRETSTYLEISCISQPCVDRLLQSLKHLDLASSQNFPSSFTNESAKPSGNPRGQNGTRTGALSAADITNSTNAIANLALSSIFTIGLKRITFTEEDKRTIGPLIANSIEPIKRSIFKISCRYHTRLGSFILQRRSSLQFLIDNYSDFPVGPSHLADVFLQLNLDESVGILDALILKLSDTYDSDEGASDRGSCGASSVPQSHVWWLH